MSIQITDTIVRTADMMTAPINDEIVMLSLVSNSYLALDNTGRRIWDLLATPIRVDALCVRLEAEFQASPGQIQQDILDFLAELKREGAVQMVR